MAALVAPFDTDLHVRGVVPHQSGPLQGGDSEPQVGDYAAGHGIGRGRYIQQWSGASLRRGFAWADGAPCRR